MSIVVVDAGTSSVRVAAVERDGSISLSRSVIQHPNSPAPGLVEFDAAQMRQAVLDLTQAVIEAISEVEAIAVTTQRASAIVWDRVSGEPVGPGIGWQDQRTKARCDELLGQGFIVTANQTASKIEWIANHAESFRRSQLCAGTIDAWVVWCLTNGEQFVFDTTNALASGLLNYDLQTLNEPLIAALGFDMTSIPRVVPTVGIVGNASAIHGAPPIAAVVGDQQSSMAGQGVVVPGVAKVTLGTGGMLNVFLGSELPSNISMDQGCYPIAAYSTANSVNWGYEAIMITAGHNVEWFCSQLGLFQTPGDLEAAACEATNSGGVVWVPALLGLGTPSWDAHAQGAVMGLSRSTTPAQIARAVLEGVAFRVAELVESIEHDAGLTIDRLRCDGGMSHNDLLCQLIASASGRTVEASPLSEMTTIGAARLAGVAIGWTSSVDDLGQLWQPRARFTPREDDLDRARWDRGVALTRDFAGPL